MTKWRDMATNFSYIARRKGRRGKDGKYPPPTAEQRMARELAKFCKKMARIGI